MKAARRVVTHLRRSGHEAWIAGGAVRDHLLQREPHDVDVATSAHPDEVRALYPGSKEVGVAFGVVIVTAEGEPVEVATFRTDGPYLDGRRPSRVTFGTLEDDAARRDFTVNGLYLDPETDEVRDLVGGRADLTAGIIRAIGDPEDRFREDHLRLLRAVRFAAQLGFEVEERTRAALISSASDAAHVAPERTREELTRILTGSDPARGLALLRDTGLLRALLPEVADLDGVPQPPQYHPEGDVLTHTILLFEHLEKPSPELAWSALLHDIGKAPTLERAPDRIRFPRHASVGAEMAEAISRRLRFSNDSRERVVDLVAQHMHFLDVQGMKPSTLKRFVRRDHFDEHLVLHRADCLASNGNLENWEFTRERRNEFGEEDLRPPRLIDGHQLMKLGWPAGPTLGAELQRLEELQLDGRITTPEQARDIARDDLGRSRD